MRSPRLQSSPFGAMHSRAAQRLPERRAPSCAITTRRCSRCTPTRHRSTTTVARHRRDAAVVLHCSTARAPSVALTLQRRAVATHSINAHADRVVDARMSRNKVMKTSSLCACALRALSAHLLAQTFFPCSDFGVAQQVDGFAVRPSLFCRVVRTTLQWCRHREQSIVSATHYPLR